MRKTEMKLLFGHTDT